jgi:hypothetical protein
MDKTTQEIMELMRGERLTLTAVRSEPGGATRRVSELGLGPSATAREYRIAADRWQNEFDADCDPVRVYVVDANGVATYAAGARQRHRGGRRNDRTITNVNTTAA